MNRPWESCMTISAHNHWAWRDDADGVKPLAECLNMLIRGASSDGNVLLNVGPRPDGRIDPEQAIRLNEIGDWLNKPAMENAPIKLPPPEPAKKQKKKPATPKATKKKP